jgi:hypothetical protein
MKPSQRCNAITRVTIRTCGMCAMAITITLALAQSPHTTPLLRKLDDEQLRSIERLVLGHAEVKNSFRGATPQVIIGEPELDKAEAQAYLNGERSEPPTTTVQTLLLDTEGNVARRVTVSPAENRVLSVEQIAPTLVPFNTDDLHAAWNLASRDPAIRRALGADIDRYHIAAPGGLEGEAYVIQALPLLSSDPNDPCSRDRCLDLIFRGEKSSYLALRAHVDLTKQTVALHGRQP